MRVDPGFFLPLYMKRQEFLWGFGINGLQYANLIDYATFRKSS